MNKKQLYPNVRLIFGFANGCPWCDRFKQRTLPMVQSLGLNHQILTKKEHLDVYKADDYGYPLIVFADRKGAPLVSHGGYLTLPELMAKMEEVYKKFYPGESPNGNR